MKGSGVSKEWEYLVILIVVMAIVAFLVWLAVSKLQPW